MILRQMGAGDRCRLLYIPSPRTDKRHLSDSGLLAAFRRMNLEREVLTVHDFRSTASMLLNGQGLRPVSAPQKF